MIAIYKLKSLCYILIIVFNMYMTSTSPQYPKNWLIPPRSPHCFAPKCWFCNFHADFNLCTTHPTSWLLIGKLWWLWRYFKNIKKINDFSQKYFSHFWIFIFLDCFYDANVFFFTSTSFIKVVVFHKKVLLQPNLRVNHICHEVSVDKKCKSNKDE